MDIDNEAQTFFAENKKKEKRNILVVGDKKSGKTSLIKSCFALCNVLPETNLLLDSVRTWEGNLSEQHSQVQASFIEMDANVEDLNQMGKLEECLRGHKNVLCLVLKTHYESATSKSLNKMKMFFDKLSQISAMFQASVVVKNEFTRKREFFPMEDQEPFVSEELGFKNMFRDVKFFDFGDTKEILNFLIEGRSPNQNKTVKVENEGIYTIDANFNTVVSNSNFNSRRKKRKIFKIAKVDRKSKKSPLNHIHNHTYHSNCNKTPNKKLEDLKLNDIIDQIVNINAINGVNLQIDQNEPTTGKDCIDQTPMSNNTVTNKDCDDCEDCEDCDDCGGSQAGNSKMNPNSLISISKEVYYYLREMVESKGSSVTEYILRHLKKTQSNLSFKNIQRRVYDAINVMNAVGILKKEKNNLLFKGKMNIESIIGSENKAKFHNKALKEKVKQKVAAVNFKQHELVGLCSKKLVSLNKFDIKRKTTCEKLGYPFTLIKHTIDASLVIKQDDYNSRLCILSDKQFDIIYEELIMKSLLKDDIKNVKMGLKSKINQETYDYLIKHNLLDKYFNNFTNFNSNNASFKEGFNTFSQNKNKLTRSPVCALDNSYSFNDNRKGSIDFLLHKAFNDEVLSHVSNNEMLVDNNYMNYNNYNNYNNFSVNPFDFSERQDFLDNGLNTNQMSTNFFSKFLKNGEDKV